MKGFGVNQTQILREFQEIRQAQAQLSMKQVAMLGEMMAKEHVNEDQEIENTDISQLVKENEASLRGLTEMLQSICKSMDEMSKKTRNL